MANLKGADRQAEDTRQKLVELVVASRSAAAALDGVKLDPAQTTATKAYAAEMKKAVDGITGSATAAGREIHDMNLQKAQVMKFISGAEAMKDELRDIRNDALAATAALDGLEVKEDITGRRGTRGQFLPGRTFVGSSPVPSSYVRGVTPTDRELLDRWESAIRRMPLALPERAGGGIPMGPASDSDFGESFARAISAYDFAKERPYFTQILGMGPQTKEQYLNQFATPAEGRRLVQVGQGEQSPYERYDFPVDKNVQAARRLAVSNAKQYLRKNKINWDDTAMGGAGGVRRDDSLAAAALLGLNPKDSSSHWSRFGFGGRGLGFGLPVPPHARFGTPLALAGFGLDRMVASTLGILGSFGGGILGGGILGAGALGTMAVGAGTNLAGMGQAVGDIHTVSKDLAALQTAIEQYGKNSTQAAQAQLQLNTDLKGFSPVARNAVLAASQTSQAFKAMFDKVTGGAEKIGAEIVNQAMQVGEKFLPIIGKFSQQNMSILQRGLQPFFGFLTKGGNAQNVIKDVNNLNQAIKEHGANSIQAAQAKEQLNIANRNTGGLAYFTDLEKVFQKRFPTAIHAGEQAFELLMKTVDLAAQHLGHFIASLNSFFTRMNNQDFGKWAVGVEHLISLFHSWFGMFVSFGKVIFALFQPTVGFGKAFADELSKIFTQISKYLNQSGTRNVLTNLFSVHLVQVIKQIGGLIENLLPIFENTFSAWLQIETQVVRAFNLLIAALKNVFGWLGKWPAADKVIGWGIAIGSIVVVNRLLLGSILPILRSIPFIGSAFGKSSAEASSAVGKVTAAVGDAAATMVAAVDRVSLAVANLGRQFLGLGPLAAESASEVDAALATEAGFASRASTRALGMVGLGGLRGGGIKGVLGKAGLYAIGGIVAGQIIQSIVPGKTGSVLGNVAKGAGIGAGIGMFVGMPEVGAAIGGVTGALVSLVHIAPSAGQALKQLGQNYRALGTAAKEIKFGIIQTRGQIAQDRQLRTEAQHQVEVARAHLRSAHGAQAQAKASQSLQIAEGNLAAIEGKLIQDEKALSDLRTKSTGNQKKQIETQSQIIKSFQELGQASQHWAKYNLMLTNDVVSKTYVAASAAQSFVQKMQQLAQSAAATNPKMAKVAQALAIIAQRIHGIPPSKTFTLIVREVFKGTYAPTKIGPGGDLFPAGPRSAFGPGGGVHHDRTRHSGRSGPSIHLGLPQAIQDSITKAEAGHGSLLKAEKAAYDFYQKQLSQPGLTQAQKRALYKAEAPYFEQGFGKPKGYQHGGNVPGSVPTGFLDKQQQETAKARLLISQGQLAAAKKLLETEKAQLQAMLHQHLNSAERTRVMNQLRQVNNLLKPSSSAGVPTGFLAKQRSEYAKARLDISQGQTAAAKRLLQAEKDQLQAMLKQHLTTVERTRVMNQLTQVNNLLSGKTKGDIGSFALSPLMQMEQARADALAALQPNLQGPTALQYKLAVEAKKAAMRAIKSHTLTMQGLIDAWGVVGQANAVIAQRMGVFANTYHAVSTDSITDAVKGLTAVQEMQLRERMAQAAAHRGFAPNQSAVGGGGSTVASPHHKQGPGRQPGVSHPPHFREPNAGANIHINTVEIHGVTNVRQLASEIEKLARQKYQRAGGRR